MLELVNDWKIYSAEVKGQAILGSVEQERCGQATAFIYVIFCLLETDNSQRFQDCLPSSEVVARRVDAMLEIAWLLRYAVDE
jgi:hypothetical protein